MAYSINEINQMSQAEFVSAFGAVYEETPAIARQIWSKRPFADGSALQQQMATHVNRLPLKQQLALIRAHPDLGSQAKMAPASVQEQSGLGLNRLSVREYERFQALNRAYKDKFGFPFIASVKNHTKDSILHAFEQRLSHSPEEETLKALAEINQIAAFRLAALVKSPTP
ncbi:2-oxo-4-hydroxy-4-carboxy-5-ureidoimidazoline decarboxylase [Romeria aff. gracilis LEGE 07310]|uniref:2-oxo-4-hydroxy-4-carboxy-5-ureidoimidazoline decarboxylase n=1 Tax=Vasconcelosia minhoensis LEGE 07310 TaxID=915328 RepID=A0A8J7DK56_9CYAN|nr:2-oxo-4-hydroxy-4-carboxy-5-ureidoimidazoline decarboxylase [Romeria gracilis]MBE9075981.1 2-oxo-4-hydroxy-4-carboxy-5-ureidoimidazoline decarboxylase [Romeria aff. gracilis LEGE 07310]